MRILCDIFLRKLNLNTIHSHLKVLELVSVIPDDAEVRQAGDTRNRQLKTADRSRRHDTDQRTLVTKPRSNTPLATVSDNESDNETGSTPRGRVGRTTPTGTVKRESPRPSTAGPGYFYATLNYFSRRKLRGNSPRTAFSLDNVDLWDEEAEISDTDDTGTADVTSQKVNGKQDFDKINGVLINPRVTVDFSEVRTSRSPVAVKRNKLDPGKDSQEVTSEGPRLFEKTCRIQGAVRPRPRSKSRTASALPRPLGGKISPAYHQAKMESDEIKTLRSPVDKKTFKMLHNTPASTLQTSSTDSDGVTSSDGSQGTKQEFPPLGISKRGKQGTSCKPIIAQHPEQRAKPVLALRAENEGVRADAKKPTEKETDLVGSSDSNSANSQQSFSLSPERKVKFNNFVTVRDGQRNTTDSLRNSHNSAQMFKQKFLRSGMNGMKNISLRFSDYS